MDTLRFELRVVADFFETDESSGAVEDAPVTRGVDEEALERANGVAFGWPGQAEDPTEARGVARFVRAFPLEFPMGTADMYE